MSSTVGNKSGVGLVAHAHAATIGRMYPDDLDAFRLASGDLAVGADGLLNRVDEKVKSQFYTPAGLPSAVEPEARAWRQELVRWRQRHVDPLASQERALLAEASKPAPARAEELIVKALRHREIRDRFAALTDAVDKQLAVDRLAAAGDADALNAIGQAPFAPLVDPAVLAKARQRMAAAASPELVRVQTLKGAYEQVAAVASEELRNVLTRFGIELDGRPK